MECGIISTGLQCRVADEQMAAWAARHMSDGSRPAKASRFAAIESALLFDWSLANELHAEVRRFAICLASVLDQASSKALVSEAEIQRWGIDAASVPLCRSFMSPHPWSRVVFPLVDARLVTDEESRVRKKRHLRLHLAPVRTNRRQSRPLERPTDVLKGERVATFAVPADVFAGDRLRHVPTREFMTLMLVYALTDMSAYGGVDPAHIRVESGRLCASFHVLSCIGTDERGLYESLLWLADAGYTWFVPEAVSAVVLPSAKPTFEVSSDAPSADSDSFVVRPTCVWGATTLGTRKADGAPSKERSIQVSIGTADLLSLTVNDDVPQTPQYAPKFHAAVVGDRVAGSLKSQIAKALPPRENRRCAIVIDVSGLDRRAGLIHVLKVLTDALVRSDMITDDSRWVLTSVDIRRGVLDEDGRPYVRVRILPDDDGKSFDRKLYVDPVEWRPPARNRPASLTDAWPSYTSYTSALEQAAATLADAPIDVESIQTLKTELAVCVHSPIGIRFDLDNVALFACDLLTVVLKSRGCPVPVDRLIDRVLITQDEDEPSVDMVLRPIGETA